MHTATPGGSMFQIKLKSTVHSNIGCQLLDDLYRYEAFLGPDKVESLKTECQTLQSLRDKVNGVNVQLTDLEDYMVALRTVVTKFRLETSKFAWSNSLGLSGALVQGNGLWFEYLNVVFNVAAKNTNMVVPDAISYRRAAKLFDFARESLLPEASKHEVPPELGADVLRFLHNMCTARAVDLVSGKDPSMKWSAATRYSDLLDELQNLPLRLIVYDKEIAERKRDLEAEAYLAAGQELRHSRKPADHLLAKDALLKCLQTNTRNTEVTDNAKSLLNEPLNRRRRANLNELEGEGEFLPLDFFTISEPIEEVPPSRIDKSTRTYFSDILPIDLTPLPTLLRARLTKLARSEITDKLLFLNRTIRRTAVKFNLPVGIEMIQAPGRLPQSLLTMSREITSAGQTESLLQEIDTCNLHISRLETRFRNEIGKKTSSEGEIFKQSLTIARSKIDELASKLKSVDYLLQILERGPPFIMEFLGFTKLRNSDKRSRPSFLNRVESVYDEVSTAFQLRLETRLKVMQKVEDLAIEEVTRDHILKHPNATIQAYFSDLLQKFWSQFTEELIWVQESAKQARSQIAVLKELDEQSKIFKRQSLMDVSKLKASHALAAAWSTWIDIKDELELLRVDLGSLELYLKIISNGPEPISAHSSQKLNSRETDTSPTHRVFQDLGLGHQFAWSPGKAINIV